MHAYNNVQFKVHPRTTLISIEWTRGASTTTLLKSMNVPHAVVRAYLYSGLVQETMDKLLVLYNLLLLKGNGQMLQAIDDWTDHGF